MRDLLQGLAKDLILIREKRRRAKNRAAVPPARPCHPRILCPCLFGSAIGRRYHRVARPQVPGRWYRSV
jgi:hypothetical protein